ncbi:esterase/lipase family protein [Segeticoccus rhizosphaerae]|uniref:esterase/lipase family protein n=1 Tax=Segeticoccus rhizosphaerae TaxID=1104777 RepID=UPI0010C0C35A|nr:alpha/beta hydrolase [Ornithinicoccus soli]
MPTAPSMQRVLSHPWLLAPFEPYRASIELASVPFMAPFLLGATRAHGQPVLAVPGLCGGNGWTLAMRSHLRALGHSPHRMHRGTMLGKPATVVQTLIDRVDQISHEEGPVGLVGWSVGGAFARQVALARPDRVRLLVTLGAPLDGAWYATRWAAAMRPLPVPVTAVYSRSDGVFDWHRCLQPRGPRAENVEIISSHLGMGVHPAALHVVADRLGQAPHIWHAYRQPFSRPERGQHPDPARSA